MKTKVVTISTSEITDWDSFHSVFQTALGFLALYGRNMGAWIDCMGCLDDPSSGMTEVTVGIGEAVALRIDDAPDFQRRCPEQFTALIEGTAFVNYRRVEAGEQPFLVLMLTGYYR